MRALFVFLLFGCSTPKSPSQGALPKQSWLLGDGLSASLSQSGDLQNHPLGGGALFALASVDAYTAWITGEQGRILYTTDGGDHWVGQESKTAQPLYAVSFANASHGVAAGAGGVFVVTEDAGAHWRAADAPEDTRSVRAVKLSAWSGVGVAVGDDGLVEVSHDGGRSWAAATGPNTALYSVDMNEDDVAVAVGAHGGAWRIDASGLVQLPWSDASARALFAVRFLPGGMQAIAAGAQGVLVKGTLDGGADLFANAALEDLYAIALADARGDGAVGIMVAGAGGRLLFAPNADAPFAALSSKTTQTIRALGALGE